MTTLYGGVSKNTNMVLMTTDDGTDPKKFKIWIKENGQVTEALESLQISRVAFEDQKKVFEHPLEDGTVITDHIIFEPKRATIQAYISVDDTNTLRELEQIYLNSDVLRIRAENKIIDNIIIASKPKEITGSIIDKTLFSISFTEAIEILPTSVSMPPKKVAKKTTASRINTGVKQAKPVKRSWAYSLFHGGRT